jgi:hypothetical protein
MPVNDRALFTNLLADNILATIEFAENEDETVFNTPEILRLAALKLND